MISQAFISSPKFPITNITIFTIIAIQIINKDHNLVESDICSIGMIVYSIKPHTSTYAIFRINGIQLNPLLYIRVALNERYQRGIHDSPTARADHSTQYCFMSI